jgi:Asp-tRNA(Asn)/Glu-tRNA(Gln) amidotransferase A subunit family amidase
MTLPAAHAAAGLQTMAVAPHDKRISAGELTQAAMARITALEPRPHSTRWRFRPNFDRRLTELSIETAQPTGQISSFVGLPFGRRDLLPKLHPGA